MAKYVEKLLPRGLVPSDRLRGTAHRSATRPATCIPALDSHQRRPP